MNNAEIRTQLFYRYLLICAGGFLTTHFLKISLEKFQILRLKIEKLIIFGTLNLIATLLFFGIIIVYSNQYFLDYGWQKYGFVRTVIFEASTGGIFIIPWTFIYVCYDYVKKINHQEINTLKLFGFLKELQLKTIKSHLNPHFIFNALNSIRALIEEDPQKSKQAITNLDNILRNSTQVENFELVDFQVELAIVKDYLALEHIRFEDRLDVQYEIDENSLKCKVPPMMLQTLVENAVKHGISKLISGGKIRIISRMSQNFHQLIIENSGNLVMNNSEGFGISSTKLRLNLLFGESAEFNITSERDLVITTVSLPQVGQIIKLKSSFN